MITSASPRAIETALAMGLAVDDTVELPSGYVPGEVDHHDQWRWPHPFRTYAELLGRGGGLAAVAEAHRRSWTSVVAAVPDGAAALVVATAAGSSQGWCLPAGRRPRVVGAPLGHCDGARVGFGDGRFVSIQFHRAPAELLPRGAKAGGW